MCIAEAYLRLQLRLLTTAGLAWPDAAAGAGSSRMRPMSPLTDSAGDLQCACCRLRAGQLWLTLTMEHAGRL